MVRKIRITKIERQQDPSRLLRRHNQRRIAGPRSQNDKIRWIDLRRAVDRYILQRDRPQSRMILANGFNARLLDRSKWTPQPGALLNSKNESGPVGRRGGDKAVKDDHIEIRSRNVRL